MKQVFSSFNIQEENSLLGKYGRTRKSIILGLASQYVTSPYPLDKIYLLNYSCVKEKKNPPEFFVLSIKSSIIFDVLVKYIIKC